MLPRVLELGTADPVHILLEPIHTVVGMKHVVQDAAREEHVVDALLLLVGHGELQDSEANLQDSAKALHIFPHALQPLREQRVAFAQRVFGTLY